jgi:hypothetical protein
MEIVIKEGRSSEEGIWGRRVMKKKDTIPFALLTMSETLLDWFPPISLKITILTISVDLRGLSHLWE